MGLKQLLFGLGKKKELNRQDVIDSMGDEVIVIDSDYNIVFANKQKRKRFGEDIVDKKCYDVFEERDNGPCKNCPTIRAINEKRIVRADWEYTHRKTGERHVADLVAAPIIQNGKDTDWAVEIVRDSTIRKRVYEVILKIQEASTEEEITKIFMDTIVKRLGFDRIRFYVIESKGEAEILKLKDWRRMKDSEELRNLELKYGEAPAVSKTIKKNEPVFFKTCDANEVEQKNKDEKNPFVIWIPPGKATHRTLLNKDEFPMWIDLPLITGAKTIGKLTLDKRGTDWDESEYDLQILGIFASSVAQAIEKSRLSELDALRNISIALQDAEQNLQETLDIILQEGLQELLEPDTGAIVLWDDSEKKDKLKVIAATDGSEGTILELNDSVCGEAVQERDTINIGDVQSYPKYKAAGTQGMKSNLAEPMIHDNEVIGVINAESRQKNAFSKKHEQLIGLLSNHATIAIQNAERYEQLKKAKKEAERHLAERESYLQSLRHELFAPINPILTTFALIKKALEGLPLDELLAKRSLSVERLEHILEDGINECKQLSFMLEGIDILGGNLELDKERSKLFKDVIMPVVSILQETAKSEYKDIRWYNIQNVPTFSFDKRKMRHVFINLLTNAIKYSDKDTDIEIEGLESTGTIARVAVSNHGLDIPEGWEEKIFERDIRGPNVEDAGFTGAGIGLTIANIIVQAHGGKIYVENNRNPTTFVVELPII